MSEKIVKVIIAGGGTGGHIYPALSIAEAIKSKNSRSEILFVGTAIGLESKIIPKAGYKLELIQSGKLNFSGQIINKLKTLLKIPIGLFQSVLIILRFKPDYVLGVGGYASAPTLLAAKILCCRTAIWEPNAHPGMANRILSKFTTKAFLVFEETRKYIQSRNTLVMGMPLRSEIENFSADAQRNKSASNAKFTILCFGGSQGSVFLNDQLSDFVLENQDLHDKINIFHQTGSFDYQRILKKYNSVSCVQVFEYIYDMPQYYKQADLLFCRGGASTLAEAAAFGVVPMVVPLPAADDHQQRNAEALVKANAGFMFLQKEFDKIKFKQIVLKMLHEPELRYRMSSNIVRIAPRKASVRIAENILQEIV